MIDPAYFRDVVLGSRRGVRAVTLRGLLRIAEAVYSPLMSARNALYDRRWRPIAHLEVPVLSIGNLTLGGTGKTPLVAWLARWLRNRGLRVALVSRGYGAPAGGRNDEALELEQRLPDVPHLQDPDRVAAGQIAIDELASQLLLLDDGFQHRRLHRDLDFVLLDALAPWGGGHVFPRGLLREPLAALGRAHAVGLSRADLIPPEERERVFDTARRLAPHAVMFEVEHRPARLIATTGDEAAIDQLSAGPIAAFCGVGNPAGFRGTLERAGAQIAAWREFPDHHAYTRDDVQQLGAWASASGARQTITTHKDLVKLRIDRLAALPLWALQIDVEIVRGWEGIERLLQPQVARALERE